MIHGTLKSQQLSAVEVLGSRTGESANIYPPLLGLAQDPQGAGLGPRDADVGLGPEAGAGWLFQALGGSSLAPALEPHTGVCILHLLLLGFWLSDFTTLSPGFLKSETNQSI